MIDTTLMYVRHGDRILLAMKKRGFGVGKWNAPGGKVDPGETPEAAAIRECQEEVGITPRHPQLLGEIEFTMPGVPGFSGHYIYVYSATEWDGEPAESDEMRPQWFAEKDIPYARMWPADRRWLPEALALHGRHFTGRVVQGPGDEIIEYELHAADTAAARQAAMPASRPTPIAKPNPKP